jgi:hypothetical protein
MIIGVPVLDQRGLEQHKYKCQTIFIQSKPAWLDFRNQGSQGYIMCPQKKCGKKLGVYSFDGIKCQTCLQNVPLAF